MTYRERANTWALVCALSALSLAGCSSSEKSVTSPQSVSDEPGSIVLTISGLPQGVDGSVVVRGPGGFSVAATRSRLIQNLAPGSYEVDARDVKSGEGDGFSAGSLQLVDVSSGPAVNHTVLYGISTGSLAIVFSGLPQGAAPAISVSGPKGPVATISRDTTLRGLSEGAYTIAPQPVVVGASEYRAGNAITVHVSASNDALPVFLRYSSTTVFSEQPNVTIEGVHIQQVVQRFDGSVPLVARRSGLLRIFVTGNSQMLPGVRVRLYHGNTLVRTSMVGPAGSFVPRSADVSSLASSWNLRIPEDLMIPGLRVLADVDPTNEVRESDEGDNTFPATGVPRSFDVRLVPPLAITFVPITQAATGLTGFIHTSNAATFLTTAKRLLPLGDVSFDLRETFTSNGPRLESNDGNKAWSQLLSEVNALRAADGAKTLYAGIARTTYNSGTAGMGYVPGNALVAWDKTGSASEVLAHELGHNFGRRHAPCGGASSPDPAFPYAGGVTGAFGYDLLSNTLRPPTLRDIMGYCAPSWISDYTWSGIINYRAATAASSYQLLGSARPTRGLLVWGRISEGVPVLEPVFEIEAPALLPESTGRNQLTVRNGQGRELLQLSFTANPVADGDYSEQHFAFVLPLDMLGSADVSEISLATASGLSVNERLSQKSAPASIRTRRMGQGRVAVEWNTESVRGVMVRSALSGRILAFGRNGSAVVESAESELDVVVSGRSVRSGSVVRVKVE